MPIVLYLDERTRRKLQLTPDDVLPLDDRLSIVLPADDLYAIVEYACGVVGDLDAIGWDLRRLGSLEDCAEDLFANACSDFAEPGYFAAFGNNSDRRREYVRDRLATFDRDRCAGDLLLVDLADRWRTELELSADTVAALDRLTDAAHERRDQIHAEMRDEEFITDQRELRDQAETEWLAFGGTATQEQVENWKANFAPLMISFQRRLDPVTVVPFPQAVPAPDLIKSSAEFVAGFEPPDYLIDSVLQRRYCYSLTAQTGVGKTAVAMRWCGHVATGRALGGLDVQQGTVLYFAGENPSDIQARWLGLTQAMGVDPAKADVHFLPGALDLSQHAQRITNEVVAKGLTLALVVVDTAAAYNFGDDENSNTQAGQYARQLRSLTQLPGGPAVLILCHPTKRAADDDLIPRGGGAFLAEVDGNIALQKKDTLLVATAQGKFRGAEFVPLRFQLNTVRDHPQLRDVRGRQIPTVVATPVDERTAAAVESKTDRDTEALLRAVSDGPGGSPTDYARALGWTYGAKQEPNQMRVKRTLERLKTEKLVTEKLGRWRTTPAGDIELNSIDRVNESSVNNSEAVDFSA